MAVTDIASRTYNHGWRLDPIVRSLLDTDFYKLLMLQMIREFYPDQRVTFSVINRTRSVRLGEHDHVRIDLVHGLPRFVPEGKRNTSRHVRAEPVHCNVSNPVQHVVAKILVHLRVGEIGHRSLPTRHDELAIWRAPIESRPV